MSPGANFAYGLAPLDRVAAITGKQFLQAIIEGEFPQAPISQALTFWIVEVGDGLPPSKVNRGPIYSIQWEPCTGAGRLL